VSQWTNEVPPDVDAGLEVGGADEVGVPVDGVPVAGALGVGECLAVDGEPPQA
jgi:hypothetical protein